MRDEEPPGDDVRCRVESLIEACRRGEPAARAELFELVLRRAVLPVAIKLFGRDDRDAQQDLAEKMLVRLPEAVRCYDPGHKTGRDGCAMFRTWTYHAGIDRLGRKTRLPEAVKRLAHPPGGPERPHVPTLYRRVVLGGEASHEVIAALAGSSGFDEATLEADLLEIEAGVSTTLRARRRAHAEFTRPAPFDPEAAADPSVQTEALVEWAHNRRIGRALRTLLADLSNDEQTVVKRRLDGASWAELERDRTFKSAYYARQAWSSALDRLRRGLESRFGEAALRSQLTGDLFGLHQDEDLEEVQR